MKVTSIMVKKFNELYEEGYTMQAIEEITGFGHSGIRRYIKNPRTSGTVGKKSCEYRKN